MHLKQNKTISKILAILPGVNELRIKITEVCISFKGTYTK